jgi:hypothetical protein
MTTKSFHASRRFITLSLMAVLFLSLPLRVAAQAGGSYSIVKSVLAGGGDSSASVNYQLTGAIGQSLTDFSSGGVYTVSSGFWNSEQAAPPGGLEGDTASRPNGSGTLTASDVTQIRRFVAGLDTATPGGEYQRADCAPLASFGNALISATDITQVRRYVAALDAPQASNGPASPGNRPQPLAPAAPAARSISVVSQTVSPGQQAIVPIVLDSQGDETAASFSVTYDPAVLSINNTAARIALGNGVPGGTTLTRNISQAANGRLGIVLDADPTTPFAAGQRQMVTITFDVTGSLTTTNVGFGDMPVVRDVSDGAANSLPVNYAPGTVSITAPTLARVAQFNGYHYLDGNLLRWQTGLEIANLGFRVFRLRNAECGARIGKPAAECLELLTPQLIAGSALQFGAGTTLTAGNSYSWWDEGGTPDAVYWIEDIALDGTRTAHGPVKIADCGGWIADCFAADVLRPQSSPTLGELSSGTASNGVIVSGYPEDFGKSAIRMPHAAIAEGSDAWRMQLRLAAGAAVKIGVRADGWQRIPAARLWAAGLPPDADPARLQLYADGVEVPLLVTATADGLQPTDAIEFYGLARDTRETDTRTYWLVAGDKPGLRVGLPGRATASGGAATPGKDTTQTPDSFAYTVERKERAIYVPSLNNGEEAENFFGTVVSSAPAAVTVNLRQLDTSAASPARLVVALQGATAGPHRVRLQLNGQDLGVAEFNGTEYLVQNFTFTQSALQEGDNQLALTALGGAGDVSLVDSVRVTYARRYRAENDQLRFTANSRRGVAVSGFSVPRVRVFNVTDPQKVFQLAARVEAQADGYAVTVAGALRGSFVAVGDAPANDAPQISANEPSQWTTPEQAADFLILAPRAFRAALEPLAGLRRAQGLRTAIVNIEDVYDEWRGGAKSTPALRAFLRWTRENWSAPPRYLLLAGDASYDPRDYLGYGDTDLLPTGYVATALLETASDESLTDFDGDGVGELSVGRFPARTPEQAAVMVNKTLGYQPRLQDGALLVADRNDGYDFAAASQALRPLLPPDMPVAAINRADGTDEQTRQQILASFNRGPALVNYAGHGSVEVWTGAGLLQTADAAQLTNGHRLPLVISMTCLNGYFHDLTSRSLAEGLLAAGHGGAAAVWASSALTLPAAQSQINQAALHGLYREEAAMRLGDAVRAAKLATNDREVRRTWLLFGDPTLAVR